MRQNRAQSFRTPLEQDTRKRDGLSFSILCWVRSWQESVFDPGIALRITPGGLWLLEEGQREKFNGSKWLPQELTPAVYLSGPLKQRSL